MKPSAVWLILIPLCAMVISSQQAGNGTYLNGLTKLIQPFKSNWQEFAREKMSQLYRIKNMMRDNNDYGKQIPTEATANVFPNTSLSFFPMTSSTTDSYSPSPETTVMVSTNNSTAKEKKEDSSFGPQWMEESNRKSISLLQISELHKIPFKNLWDSLKHFWKNKRARDGILNHLIPRSDLLQKLSSIRNKLEPHLRDYFTNKYNSFLSNLVPYSDTIGVPPYVLNSMKIPQNFDPRWQIIESILQNASLDSLLNMIPDFTARAHLEHDNDNVIERRMKRRSNDPVQVVISEKEAKKIDDGSKNNKKKRGTSPSPSKNKVKQIIKNDATSFDNSIVEFDKNHDQIGMFAHDSYDTNFKNGHHEDYYYTKSYGYGGKPKQSSPTEDIGENNPKRTFRSHGTAKGYGHGGSGGHGGGSYGSGMMDPFSILGGLAFLTYLGLLLQQTLNQTAMGRAFPDFNNDGGTRLGRYGGPIKLTPLVFEGKRTPLPERNRRRPPRSVTETLRLTDVVHNLEFIWEEIESLDDIVENSCRLQKLCQILKMLDSKRLLSLFEDAVSSKIRNKPENDWMKAIVKSLHEKKPSKCGINLNCYQYNFKKRVKTDFKQEKNHSRNAFLFKPIVPRYNPT